MFGYLIFMVPALILTIFAQSRVSSVFKRYSQVRNSRGYTGAQAASVLLNRNGLSQVRIEPIGGSLSDLYDPRSRTLKLSETVYDSASIAAIGVAAHEVGHAIQHNQRYGPLEFRHAMVPVTNFASGVSWLVIILGFLLQWSNMVLLGIILFSVVVLFHLITLPVEFNASQRAVVQLSEAGLINADEAPMVKKVLGAAALTYVAATLSSVMTLLYYVMMFAGGSDD